MILAWLAACSSAPPSQTAQRPHPDAEATVSAIDALCKLFEGAGQPCERRADGVTSGPHELAVRAETWPDERSLGIVSLRGLVHVGTPRGPFVTRLAGFGGTRADGMERAMHEWAVVSGVAVVDAVLDPTGRPALAALEPGQPPVPLALGGRAVLRGWPVVRPPQAIDHHGLLAALAPAVPEPSGVLTFDVTRQGGALTVQCWVQGEAHEPLCEAARGWAWPERDHELRLAYVVLPPS